MSSETAGIDFWVVEPEGTSMGTHWGPIQRKMGVYFGFFFVGDVGTIIGSEGAKKVRKVTSAKIFLGLPWAISFKIALLECC